jgi:hypothetical protein
MTFSVIGELTKHNAACYLRNDSLGKKPMNEVAKMIRKINLTFLSFTLASFGALAQPPEEVPPPPPDSPAEIQAIPAEAPQAQPVAVAQPVAEPRQLPKPAAAHEDARIKGISLSPGVGIYPFGYDSINLGTDNNEGGRMFFGLKPMLGIGTSFRTATDKTIDFSVDYSMLWREYYNKATTTRDIENAIDGMLKIAWNDRLSTIVTSSFSHFFKAGTDESADNALLVDTEPQFWIQANSQLKFKIGYWVRFMNSFDSHIAWFEANSITDPPADLDDMKRGIPYSDTSYADNYAGDQTQPYWINDHAAVAGVKYSPI